MQMSLVASSATHTLNEGGVGGHSHYLLARCRHQNKPQLGLEVRFLIVLPVTLPLAVPVTVSIFVHANVSVSVSVPNSCHVEVDSAACPAEQHHHHSFD